MFSVHIRPAATNMHLQLSRQTSRIFRSSKSEVREASVPPIKEEVAEL